MSTMPLHLQPLKKSRCDSGARIIASAMVLICCDLAYQHVFYRSSQTLFARADIPSEDLFQKELAMEERLDTAIDRAVKRRVQAKAMKQMLASPSLNRQLNGQAQQPKRISASNRAEPQPSTQEH